MAVVERLGLTPDQWSLSYQSRLGPVKWLEPSTTKTVEALVKNGVKKLAIVAPAFLADGLETLEELNIGIREEFMEHGGTELKVISCLNDDQQWIEGLEQLIRKRVRHRRSLEHLGDSLGFGDHVRDGHAAVEPSRPCKARLIG